MLDPCSWIMDQTCNCICKLKCLTGKQSPNRSDYLPRCKRARKKSVMTVSTRLFPNTDWILVTFCQFGSISISGTCENNTSSFTFLSNKLVFYWNKRWTDEMRKTKTISQPCHRQRSCVRANGGPQRMRSGLFWLKMPSVSKTAANASPQTEKPTHYTWVRRCPRPADSPASENLIFDRSYASLHVPHSYSAVRVENMELFLALWLANSDCTRTTTTPRLRMRTP